MLATSHKRTNVRVVTIKHPPAAIEGLPPDNSMIGKIYDLPPHLAILMIAAGWVRNDTRSRFAVIGIRNLASIAVRQLIVVHAA